jgi:hypothetical protein
MNQTNNSGRKHVVAALASGGVGGRPEWRSMKALLYTGPSGRVPAPPGKRFLISVLATVCLVVTGAGAATNYVDRNYSGTETGSTNQPFNTIREAVAAANANAGARTQF